MSSGKVMTYLLGTGTMTYELLVAANELEKQGISAEVVHVPTIKPLDEVTILASAKKTGRVVTAEEAQIAGGFGGAVAGFLVSSYRRHLNGSACRTALVKWQTSELLEHFGLTGYKIAETVKEFVDNSDQYYREG